MKRIFLSVVIAMISIALEAKSIVFTGSVKDDAGLPVPGAVVSVSGNMSNAVMTDADGNFSISTDVAEGSISVQCLGYQTATLALDGRSVFTFVLKSDAVELEGTVIVGYGSMKSSDITGSIAQVKVDELEATRAVSAEQMLLGRAAGVQVTTTGGAPGAGMNIRIRGNSSFNGGGEPLYVVDGIIINSDSGNLDVMSRATGLEEEETSGLLGINPQDIASIEILKDASATAIYGALGANGVVLITTKSAKKDNPVITFSLGAEIAGRSNTIGVMDLDTFVQYNEANGYTGLDNKIYIDPSDHSKGYKVQPVFWQDRLMRTAVNQRYYFSVANKRKGTKYMFSAGYKANQGILKSSDLNQFNARMNVEHAFNDRFNVGMRINFSRVESNRMQSTSSSSMTSATSAIRSMINSLPFMYDDEDDDPTDLDDDEMGARADRWIKDFSNKRTETRFIPNLNVEYKALDWLTAKVVAGGDIRIKNSSKWKGPYVTYGTDWSLAGKGSVSQMNCNIDALLLFDKSFHRHNISGTVGATFFHNSSRADIREGWNINQYMAQDDNIDAAPLSSTKFSYNELDASTLSFLARVIYSYSGRYIVTATFRRDGSSRFAEENKFANFPSFAVAWRINEEPWFNIDKIAGLKLRAGWGRVGNQAIASYQTLSNYSSVYYPDHTPGNEKKVTIGLIPVNLANKGLKWETTQQYNAGLDFRYNRNLFSFSIDFYLKDTFDLLQCLPVPATTGYDTMWTNIGSIRNKGVEFSFEVNPVKTKNVQWTIFGNISRNVNKITEIGIPVSGKEAPHFFGADIGNANYCKTPVNIFVEGKPMGLFYGIRTNGIIGEGETGPGLTKDMPLGPGSIRYVDKNNDGVIDFEDRDFIGDPNPDFTYGFGTNFSWKNLSLDVQFEGNQGNDIANLNLIQEWDISRRRSNIRSEAFLNAWTPENPNTTFPKLGCYVVEEDKFFTDRHVQDGSYLRLSTVSISYTVPIKKKTAKFVKGLSIALTGNNLLCFTKYNGWDPNVSVYGSNMMKMGVDFASYPAARTVALDVKLNF